MFTDLMYSINNQNSFHFEGDIKASIAWSANTGAVIRVAEITLWGRHASINIDDLCDAQRNGNNFGSCQLLAIPEMV